MVPRRKKEKMPMPKVCTCGRSETGQCVGLHSLSAQEFFERQHNAMQKARIAELEEE